MRFIITVVVGFLATLSVDSAKVPLLPKSIYRYGSYVNVNGPETEMFMAPDFGISTSKIYKPDGSRAIFFGPLNLPGVDRRHAEFAVSIGEQIISPSAFEFVTVNQQTLGSSRKHAVDCEGQLALGPDSKIARARVIEISSQRVQTDVGSRPYVTPAMEIFAAIPAVPAGMTDKSLRIVGREDGWFVRAGIKVNNRQFTKEPVQISLDPTSMGIEVPKSAMHKLTVILKLSNLDVRVSDQGRVLIPCSADGMFAINPVFSLEIAPEEFIQVVHPARTSPSYAIPDRNNGKLMCPSSIVVDMQNASPLVRADGSADIEGGEWRIDPLMIENINSVFFEGRKKSVTLRFGPNQEEGDIITSKPAPVVHQYDGFSFIRPSMITQGKGVVVFPAVLDPRPDVPKYVLDCPKAVKRGDGALMFTFSRHSLPSGIPTSSREISGVYELENDMMEYDAETQAVMLYLKPAEGTSSSGNGGSKKAPQRYTVSVEQSEYITYILLTPVGTKKTSKLNDIDKALGSISSDYRSMGKLTK